MIQAKWLLAISMGVALSGFAASAAFAGPTPNPGIVHVSQAVGAPPPALGSVLSLEPAVTSTITSTVTPTTTVTPTSTLSPGNEKIAQAIADRFGVDFDEVLAIHEEVHGWGQVFFVFLLADRTGESAEDIWTMRESGKGWGQIFVDVGLKPGHGKDNLGGAVTGKSTPTPSGPLAPVSSSSDSTNNCKGNPNNNGKGNPCLSAPSTPVPPSRPSGNSNSNGNNGNGNGKGKGGK